MQLDFSALVHTIQDTHHILQQDAIKAVNKNLTIRNWLIEIRQSVIAKFKLGEFPIPGSAAAFLENKNIIENAIAELDMLASLDYLDKLISRLSYTHLTLLLPISDPSKIHR